MSAIRQKSTVLRNEAGTPLNLFKQWHSEYRFTIDICAVEHNAKLDNYLTPEDNALARHWTGRVWCNPPFADIHPWLAHAAEPDFAAFLLPTRTDRKWWQIFKPLAECHYIVGQAPSRRPCFVAPPGLKYTHPGMSLALLLFGEGTTAGRERWRCGRSGRLFK